MVRSESIVDDRMHMVLAAGRERLEVDFAGTYTQPPAGMPPVDSTVSVRGEVSPIFNGHHQLLGSTLYASGADSVRATSTPPADPFNVPMVQYDRRSWSLPRRFSWLQPPASRFCSNCAAGVPDSRLTKEVSKAKRLGYQP